MPTPTSKVKVMVFATAPTATAPTPIFILQKKDQISAFDLLPWDGPF
jgi:hypothetical protein